MMTLITIFLASMTAHQSTQTLAQFEGRWVAPAPTRGVTALTISRVEGDVVVDVAGACVPNDCRWRRQTLTLFHDALNPNDYNRAVGVWNEGWHTTYATLTAGNGSLVVEVYRVYTDNSGRSNTYFSDSLVRQ
jgi:hypothetical protein